MYIPALKNLEQSTSSGRLADYVREQLGGNYAKAVPMVGTYDNEGNYVEGSLSRLQDVGRIILADENLYNSFAKFLPNRIARVIIQSRLYRNPLEAFKLGMIETGDIIEEVYVKLLRSHEFNPEKSEKTIFKREIPDIMSAFHRVNIRLFYKLTISYDQLRGAFVTWSGLRDLVGRLIEQCYTSANLDEYILFKYVMARAILDKMAYPVTIPEVSKENAADIVTEMVTYSNLLPFFSTDYNAAGVPTFTDRNDLITIINAKFSALRNINVLATAFNMDKAELEGRVVTIDGFGFSNLEVERLKFMNEQSDVPFVQLLSADEIALLNTVPAIAIDRSFFMIIDQLFELKNIENGEGLYWNYWLHTWKWVDYSPFANCIAFTTTESTAEVTALTPATATIKRGATKQFTATVTATGFANDGVNYSLIGSGTTVYEVKSTVDTTGLVTIAPDEQNSALQLVAIAKSNNESQKTAAITITD